MNRDEFDTGITRLERYFAKAYPADKRMILIEKLKTWNVTSFTRVVEWLIETKDRLPNLRAFYEGKTMLRESKEFKSDVRAVHTTCSRCNGLGLLPVLILTDDMGYKRLERRVARCTCDNRENWDYSISTISQIRNKPEFDRVCSWQDGPYIELDPPPTEPDALPQESHEPEEDEFDESQIPEEF